MPSFIGVRGEMDETKQFEWKIADFFSLSAATEHFYKSPSFRFENTSLHLSIFPGGLKGSKTGFLALFLINDSECLFHEKYSLHIKKADGSLTDDEIQFSTILPHESRGYYDFYERSDLEQNKSELAPSDTLTIVCIMKPFGNIKRATRKADNKEMCHAKQIDEISDNRTPTDVLSEKKELSANKDTCDVILEVQGKKFRAHKAILMAGSSVFATIFQHDTLEKQTEFIKISDCDNRSFQKFLDYLYRGKLEAISFHCAFNLYSTSSKYDVQKLKEFCIKYLIKCLSTQNVCSIAELADKYDEIKLMIEIQKFFNENWSIIIPTTPWERLIINNPRLANTILVEYSKAKGKANGSQ